MKKSLKITLLAAAIGLAGCAGSGTKAPLSTIQITEDSSKASELVVEYFDIDGQYTPAKKSAELTLEDYQDAVDEMGGYVWGGESKSIGNITQRSVQVGAMTSLLLGGGFGMGVTTALLRGGSDEDKFDFQHQFYAGPLIAIKADNDVDSAKKIIKAVVVAGGVKADVEVAPGITKKIKAGQDALVADIELSGSTISIYQYAKVQSKHRIYSLDLSLAGRNRKEAKAVRSAIIHQIPELEPDAVVYTPAMMTTKSLPLVWYQGKPYPFIKGQKTPLDIETLKDN